MMPPEPRTQPFWRRADLGAYDGSLRRVPPVLAVEVAGADDGDSETALREKAKWFLHVGVSVLFRSRPRSGGNWDISVKQVAGGEAVNRTADHPGADKVPSWSRDGTQIAFWSDRDGGGYYVMSALACVRSGAAQQGLERQDQ